MSTANVNDPGVPFEHFYELPDGVRIPALHPMKVQMEGGVIAGDTAIEKLRDSVMHTVAEAHRPLIANLTLHQLTVMQSLFTGWCGAYYTTVMHKAAGAAAKAPAPQPAPEAPRAAARPSTSQKPVTNAGGGRRTIQQPLVPLIPGEPLPGLLGGHRWGTHDAPPFKFKAPVGQQCTVPN